MDEAIFNRELSRAMAMGKLNPGQEDYWLGYQRGLRRAFQGESFGTEEDHEKWLSYYWSLDHRIADKGQGYRAGLRKGGLTKGEKEG